MAAKKAKILLVEDDIPLRDMYQTRLSVDGYDVIVAENGEEALAKTVEEKPLLILLDIMMPKISGFDVLEILKATPEMRHIPVVILTALIQEEDIKRALNSGAADYIIKSESMPVEVLDKIERILQKTKALTN